MKSTLVRFLPVFLLAFSIQCKKSNTILDATQDRKVLETYFEAATVGVVPANEALNYVLKSPLRQTFTEEQLQKVIQLDPKVDGKVLLTNNTILSFVPAKPLMADQTYIVHLNLHDLDPKTFDKNISYQIKTIPQDMQVEYEGALINDDGTISVILGIKTADQASPDDLKKCFNGGQNIEVTNRANNSYLVEVKYTAPIAKNTTISYNGKPIHCSNVGSVSLSNLNFDNFNILNNYHDIDKNEVQVYFSRKLNSSQDLTGLVTLMGQNANYTVSNNKITIYLSQVANTGEADITIFGGVKSDKNEMLGSDKNIKISLQLMMPDARFVSDGHYFPSEGDMKIPIKTRALEAIRIVAIEIKQENVVHYLAWQNITYNDMYNIRMYGRPVFDQVIPLSQGIKDKEGWTVYGLDLTQKINRNPGSIYHISLAFGPAQTNLACKPSMAKNDIPDKLPSAEYFDNKEEYYEDYYYGGEDYDWKFNNDPCKPAFYVHRQIEQRLMICSDYSIIVKKANKDYHVALSKLLDLSNVSGADVTLYDLQGSKIQTSTTSNQGFAVFEKLPREASVVKVEKNHQATYLALDENQSNSLAEFDISGEKSELETSFFVYGEREVWRPGDSIFIDLMVNTAQITLPSNLPITAQFFNTENVIIDQKTVAYNPQKRIYTFTFHTNSQAKTGTHRIVFKIGAKKVVENIRIETVKPNTTEVIYTFDNTIDGTIYAANISGSLKAQYLTGFDLKNAKIDAKARVKKINKPFLDFGNYTFDISNNVIDNNIDIWSGQTTQDGTASFSSDVDLKIYNSPISVSLETETTLADGGSSKEGRSIKVSPFDSYVGCSRRPGQGWNSNHTFEENIVIDLISLNNRGKKMSKSTQISYKIQEHISSWWVDKYRLRSDGNFVNREYWRDVKNGDITITGLGKLTLPKGSLKRGAYRVICTDIGSEHRSEVFFTVYDGIQFISDVKPDLVDLQTDKENYKTGEDVRLKLPKIPGAKVLISIERGNKIIEQVWYNITDSEAEIVLSTDENWAPNAYIHATIIQPYAQVTNDLPLRMYGIKHISIDDISGPLKLFVNLPTILESNKSYSFSVTESAGKPMEYTYALVDEGLLNLTGYETPDPTKHFNGRYPLLVKTWDIYKYLIDFFKGKFAGIISIGGDNVYNPDAIVETNRFKPLVIHKGSFTLASGGRNNHTINIPNYIGKVRLMIVAVGNTKFGNFSQLSLVKNPLMVQAQLPRTLNISDKLSLPVTILRDDKSITSATLSATATNGMIKGLTPKNIVFGKNNQLTEKYNIEILNKAGKIDLEMAISGNGKSMKEKTQIAVNYPNPYASIGELLVIEPGAKVNINIKPQGYSEAFNAKLVVAGAKFPDLGRYLEDLIVYPYGCLEQTTSAGFGQLYLDKILNLDPAKERERQSNLQTTVAKLSKFQKSNGRFSYWENDYYHPWSDVYAGNFLIEMKNRSLIASTYSGMLTNWMSAQEKLANDWSISQSLSTYTYQSESMAQAYRLYTLAKGSRSAKSALNKFASSNKSTHATVWWFVAGAYAYSGYDSKAKEFITKAENMQKSYQSNEYDSFGSEPRDLAIAVEVLAKIQGQSSKSETYYSKMVDLLNKQNWHSTQTIGHAFLSTYKYYGTSLDVNRKIEYTISGLGNQKLMTHSQNVGHTYPVTTNAFAKNITIENKGKSKIYVNRIERFISTELVQLPKANILKMSTSYFNSTKRTSGTTNVTMGDDIEIKVNVSNTTGLSIEDLALNLKMPAGWELINPRIYATSATGNENYIYQDYRDDRVYTFFEIPAGKSITYTFKAKAVFSGDFFLPATTCEHMYKGDIYASSGSGRIVIK
jgi:alpha-2-macroglobulin